MAMGRLDQQSQGQFWVRHNLWSRAGPPILWAGESGPWRAQLRRLCRGAVREVPCGDPRRPSLPPGVYFRLLLIGCIVRARARVALT